MNRFAVGCCCLFAVSLMSCNGSNGKAAPPDSGLNDAKGGWAFDPKAVPQGCEDFVKLRRKETKAFECQPETICEYAAMNDRLEVLLFLRVNKLKRIDPAEGQISYSNLEAEHNRRCLADYLSGLGLKTNVKGGFVEALQDVEVVGPYGQLVSVVRQLDSVWDVEVVCQDKARCDDCASIEESACRLTPLCGIVQGYKREGAMCVKRSAACLPFDSLCSDKFPFGVRDPQGTCWVLDSACTSFPSGWRADAACERVDTGCSVDVQQPNAPAP